MIHIVQKKKHPFDEFTYIIYHLCIVHTWCKLSEGIYILYKKNNVPQRSKTKQQINRVHMDKVPNLKKNSTFREFKLFVLSYSIGLYLHFVLTKNMQQYAEVLRSLSYIRYISNLFCKWFVHYHMNFHY